MKTRINTDKKVRIGTDRKVLCRVAIVFGFLVLPYYQTSNAEMVWQAANSGIDDLALRSVAVSADKQFVCAASANRVYLSRDNGQSWQTVFSLEAGQINFVTFSPANLNIIYLATTRGLFSTQDQGLSWRKIFRRVAEEDNNVRWVTPNILDCDRIYIGTDSSLYISQDKGETWRKGNGGLKRSAVKSIAVDPSNCQLLYLANSDGLFKSIDGGGLWEKIYATSEQLIDSEDEQDLSEVDENDSLINCIAVSQNDPRKIFIATGRGIFISSDVGESWSKLPAQGLSSDYVNFIAVSDEENSLYAASQNGVFRFSPSLNRWREIYQGMTARDVRSLAFSKDGRQLFAATDKGVFKTINPEKAQMEQEAKPDLEQRLKELCLNEPTIQQVQQAALQYAEVIHPESIKALRRDAKLKALLPDFSVDYDKTINYDSGADRYYVGPYDWGFSLSWDIGDLVFNEQVRLINSNARLLVQLRDDILNEVTRLYYERRKLQTALIFTPPQTLKDKLTQTLRLEELTANIDALTGNYFSQRLKNIEENR